MPLTTGHLRSLYNKPEETGAGSTEMPREIRRRESKLPVPYFCVRLTWRLVVVRNIDAFGAVIGILL